MTEREALKLALEVLEYPGNIWYMNCPKDKAITAIKEALKQAEPVIDKSAAVRIATALGWTPQRTWVGLTGFEQKELMAMSARDAVFATEAKLKAKNA